MRQRPMYTVGLRQHRRARRAGRKILNFLAHGGHQQLVKNAIRSQNDCGIDTEPNVICIYQAKNDGIGANCVELSRHETECPINGTEYIL